MNVVLLYNYICIYIYIQISILSHLCYLCFTPLLFDFISIIETSVIFEYKYIIIYNNIKLDYNMTKFWEIGKKSVCILRNYVAHAKELNNPLPKKPIYFIKPTTAYLQENSGPILLPKGSDVHHEVELGVVIGETCTNVDENDAMKYVDGYALTIDMTARDIQTEARNNSMPWTEAKCFDTFMPISTFIPKSQINDPHDINLWLKVDDELRQDDSTNLMIFSIPTLISEITKCMTLEKGDVIATGTPQGVGPVVDGQTIRAGIKGVIEMKFDVKDRGY